MTKTPIDFEEKIIRDASNTISQLRFIQDRKQLALTKLKDLNFPSGKDEDWKYFDFNDILGFNQNVQDQQIEAKDLAALIDKYVYRETVSNLIVTIDGNYSKELSNFKSEQIKIVNFNKAEEIEAQPELKSITEKFFAQNLEQETKYFKTVNTILMDSGFLLHIQKNYNSQSPIQILHISTKANFNQIRSLIYAGANSNTNLIVNYIGHEASKYLTNAVIETYLDDGAELKLDKIQNESKQSTCLYNLEATLCRDSKFEFNSFSFGAKSSRDDININLNGEAADASINGLYVVNGDRKSHHKVVINHNAPHTQSSQLFKGILQDQSRAEFNGLIEVARAAQKTNALQLNKNLLLSDSAHVDSRPQLNILADDVKCAHGSTVGNISAEELFYLNSRGLSDLEAKAILTYSFCQEVIDKISIESGRNYASNLAFASLGASHDGTLEALAENKKFKHSRYD
ncbi:MAG: Fe-S cluster assembly protein SufD [Cyanobacteria bacterium]|nr:Fe-S cluster assembly protein SufD [Cyanobacteriota bacterium]